MTVTEFCVQGRVLRLTAKGRAGAPRYCVELMDGGGNGRTASGQDALRAMLRAIEEDAYDMRMNDYGMLSRMIDSYEEPFEKEDTDDLSQDGDGGGQSAQ